MNIGRKLFLSTLVGGSVGLIAASSKAETDVEKRKSKVLPPCSGPGDEAFWKAVRREYVLEPGYRYFNTGGLGPVPERVLAAAETTARQLQRRSEGGRNLIDKARAQVGKFLGVTAGEIAFVRNTTEGNSIISTGLSLREGDEVILESHAHPGGSFPWLAQERFRGVKVRFFDPSAADQEENVARIAALFSSRTRAVQVSHVTAPTGIVMPVASIAGLCRKKGVWFHVDGAQSAGMFPVDLAKVGCDSYATSGHKWLGAPHETGVLFVRRDRLSDVAPFELGGNGAVLEQLPGEMRLTGDAVRFELGTRSASSAEGMAAAVEWMNLVGMQQVAARGIVLKERIRSALESMPDVEVLTPRIQGMHAAMIAFRSPRVGFRDLVNRLLREHQCRCRAVSEQGLDAVRVSLHLCTLPEECDALLEGVARILKKA